MVLIWLLYSGGSALEAAILILRYAVLKANANPYSPRNWAAENREKCMLQFRIAEGCNEMKMLLVFCCSSSLEVSGEGVVEEPLSSPPLSPLKPLNA